MMKGTFTDGFNFGMGFWLAAILWSMVPGVLVTIFWMVCLGGLAAMQQQ